MLSLTITHDGFDAARAKIAALSGFEIAELADTIGQLLESSTQDRIANGKASPDGVPWHDWSPTYAATRGPQHSLLVGEGDLRESVQNYSSAGEVRVGTPLIYGAAQNFGPDEGAPGREFLGVSGQDEMDIRDLITGRLGGLFR